MKKIWKLQDAKAHFSQLVQDALDKGPQLVTRRGAQAVVVLSVEQYEKMKSHVPGLKEFLLKCPRLDEELPMDRQKDYPRKIEL